MAAKLNLLKLFNTGQGIAGGLSNYVNYPVDHDSNYTAIETTVNQMIDEVTAARLGDSAIPADMLTTEQSSEGRYSAEDAAISTSGDIITITSGPIYVNGQKVTVVGQSFDMNGFATDTWYVNTDVNGLLNISTASGNAFFDICDIVWTTPTTFGTITDNLWNDGEVLNNIHSGYLQQPGNPPGAITDRFDPDYPGRLRPALRYKGRDGTLGAAGLMGAEADQIFITSGLDGSSDTVLSQLWTANGQQLFLEQARCMLVRSTNQSVNNAGNVPIQWDTLPTSNTAGIAERFEPESYVASTEWQTGASNIALLIPNDGAFNGTYMFTATVNIDTGTATYFDMRIAQTVGGSQVVARQRQPSVATNTVLTLCGLYDFVATDQLQVQITHDSAAAVNVTFARFSCHLVGGGV